MCLTEGLDLRPGPRMVAIRLDTARSALPAEPPRTYTSLVTSTVCSGETGRPRWCPKSPVAVSVSSESGPCWDITLKGQSTPRVEVTRLRDT